MNTEPLQQNKHAKQLAVLLETAQNQKKNSEDLRISSEKVHVAGAGGTLTAAYEQLRNAAENAEEHLLFQRAIRRFYRRLFLLNDVKQITNSGEELIIELTLAGYIENDSVPERIVKQISSLAAEYFATHETLVNQRKIAHKQAEDWTLDVLSVKVDWLINDPALVNVFVQVTHGYFTENYDLPKLFQAKKNEIETSLFAAIHRVLLKSDAPIIRASLLEAYRKSPRQLDSYVSTNKLLDKLITDPLTDKLSRYIDRKGAPLRVLRRMIDDNDKLHETLQEPATFLTDYTVRIENEYSTINSRINRGIIKSVIFLIITKFLIGVAIEVPYDYLVAGSIIWMPLIINLAFPPIYMILLRSTLLLPGQANTNRLLQQIEQILFRPPVKQLERRLSTSFGLGYNLAYALIFIIVFGGVGYTLWRFFGFDLLHLSIFFLFLSGASFLGFRLSRMIREIEAIDSDQNAITTVRDFLYMPFVVVGRFMSEKYEQVNIVALSLDMLIELPLKTVLRLIRQWGAFISSKKDEL
jgi:hypothetical protein